jgi:ParB-like chromosome segregation protein Spo0J
MASKAKTDAIMSELYNSMGDGVKAVNGGGAAGKIAPATDGLQVVYFDLDILRPDPIQPRRVLPERLHQALHNQQLAPDHALRELVQIVQAHARSAGRPFNNPFEWLGKLGGDVEDDESDHWKEAPTTPLTPEEQILFDLVQLAATLQDDGQVNPITVVDITQGVTHYYLIETGERRYWATMLLRHFHPTRSHNGRIPCLVIPSEKASPFRQAKENTSRAGLNAVAMARQIALLLLHIHGIQLPMGPVTMDFYRQALNLDLRGKREYTEAVYAALGGVSKRQLSGYKALLALGDEAIELADRHNIEESLLRYVVQLENQADQVELIRQIISLHLTRKQVADIVEKGFPGVTNFDDEPEHLPKMAMQLAKLGLKPITDVDNLTVAQAFLALEKDRTLARARIRSLIELLEEAEHLMKNEVNMR